MVAEGMAYSWRVAVGGLGLFLAIVLATAVRFGSEGPLTAPVGESASSSTAGSPGQALGDLPLAFERTQASKAHVSISSRALPR